MKDPKYKILHVDDEVAFHAPVNALINARGHDVDSVDGGVQAINILQKNHYDLVLLDINMPQVNGMEVLDFIKEKYPSTEVIMLTGITDLKMAVQCMHSGAFYYLTKPFVSDELIHIVSRALEHRKLLLENTIMRSQLSRIFRFDKVIGTSDAMRKVIETAEHVAPTNSTVLIQGASGTGKDLIANFMHKKSLRSNGPFVAINCASIPDTLMESELFGYEKGAFTDAKAQKQGLVELAHSGTLFLDEVGDVSPIVQPKLLRFIQTGEFRRIGGKLELKVDVRIISATNKDLRKEMKEGKFREDLFYRINVISISIPPLRERKEDIPLLTENFLKNVLRMKRPKEISREALDILMKYEWPGNIRELENILEGAAILSKGDVITQKDLNLPLNIHATTGLKDGQDTVVGSLISMKDIEKIHVAGVLRATQWDKNESARILGISLKTLYSKIAQYNIEQP